MTDRVPQAEVYAALDTDVLMKEASDQAGLSDYGDLGFLKPLRLVRECFSQDTKFHAAGLKEFRRTLVRQLVNRLRIEEDFKRHPEILEEDVSDPIVVLGMPRSGTTKFQRMVATDPNLLKTFMWQVLNPAPFPDAVPGEPDPRIAGGMDADALMDKNNTKLRAAHVFSIEVPQDEAWLLRFTFNDDLYISNQFPSESFEEWVTTRSEPSDLDNYKYMKSLIQYLQWQQGGRQGRRWYFKTCNAMAHLDEMVELFPNATYVHLHRDPRAFTGSLCRIVEITWPTRVVDVDPNFIGQFQLKRSKRTMDRYLESRDRLGLNDKILDVPYEQVRTNPMPAIKELYRRAGHVLTPESERGMLQWEAENEQGKHGKHEYKLEDYGLSNEKVDEAYKDYIERFINRDA